MRLGQTSAIQFGSKILISAVGFFATLYFARVVGAEVLGTYFLLLSGMAWLMIVIEAGITESITKRMTEGSTKGSYLVVGASLVFAVFTVISVVLLGLAGPVRQYIGAPMAAVFLVALVGGSTAMSIANAGLNGTHNVHISGILTGGQSVVRVAIQVAAVSVGLGLLGLVGGWVIASVTMGLIGLLYVSRELEFSSLTPVFEVRARMKAIYEYARYSWLSSFKAKTNNYADILILGLFVPNGLIGVYAVSWNIASFLTIFGAAIQETLFPELSRVAASGDEAETVQLVDQSLQFTGLFVIPGLFGGAVLGPRILRLYGPDFEVGTAVLYLLIVAVLLFDYQKQLTNALNGMDRPDLAFRVNSLFIVTNIALNFTLIALLGWIGAAIATVISSAIGLGYSYVLTHRLIEVGLPVDEVGKQIVASVLMALIVYGLLWFENAAGFVNSNFVVVGGLVAIGGTVYLTAIMLLSHRTRAAVLRNLGIEGRFV